MLLEHVLRLECFFFIIVIAKQQLFCYLSL